MIRSAGEKGETVDLARPWRTPRRSSVASLQPVPAYMPTGAAEWAASAPPRSDLPRSRFLYLAVKRLIDIVVALFCLALLVPLYLILTLLVRLDSPGPILYRRRVLARHGYASGTKPSGFDAFKFRTMVKNADEILHTDPQLQREYEKEFKLRNDPRVTRLGAKLRALSLDELPQLLNVLRGQMTLVGPRMISPPELAMYGAHGDKMLSVKPGLTGLWQVSGRQDISYPERVRLDLWYIEHQSLRLDMAILWRTAGSVLSRTGAF